MIDNGYSPNLTFSVEGYCVNAISPLSGNIADREKAYQTIEFLLQKGTKADCISEKKITALHRAIFMRNLDIARLLMRYGADVNYSLNKNGDSRALMSAYVTKQYEFAQELLDMGAEASPEMRKALQEKLNKPK